MMKLIGTCGPVVSVFGPQRYDADISMPVYSFASDKQQHYACMTCINVQKYFESIGCLFQPSSCTWYVICPSDS